MVKERALVIPGDPSLEGLLYSPADVEATAVVVVCHPHPQYGGDMHNLVVSVIVRGLIEAGFGALAFNFRGVGGSEGDFDGGRGEREDVRTVLAHARSLPGVSAVALAGYSFGAGVAAAVADDSLSAVALVAMPPAMARGDDVGLVKYANAVLFVSGDADQISPAEAIRVLASGLPGRAEAVIVPGADHFWWGQERPLADAVRDFFARELGATPAGQR